MRGVAFRIVAPSIHLPGIEPFAKLTDHFATPAAVGGVANGRVWPNVLLKCVEDQEGIRMRQRLLTRWVRLLVALRSGRIGLHAPARRTRIIRGRSGAAERVFPAVLARGDLEYGKSVDAALVV